jgi:hypothetical protein
LLYTVLYCLATALYTPPIVTSYRPNQTSNCLARLRTVESNSKKENTSSQHSGCVCVLICINHDFFYAKHTITSTHESHHNYFYAKHTITSTHISHHGYFYAIHYSHTVHCQALCKPRKARCNSHKAVQTSTNK